MIVSKALGILMLLGGAQAGSPSGHHTLSDEDSALTVRDDLHLDPDEEKVVLGEYSLIHLKVLPEAFEPGESYEGQVKGIFCKLDFSQLKEDASKAPFYMNVIKSSECNKPKNQIELDLFSTVQKLKAFDSKKDEQVSGPRSVSPTGFVFHEGRCGSTLVSNSLMALDPEATRVYSEPKPPLQALLQCDRTRANCNFEKATSLFRDVVLLMGRTNDPSENRLFFKLLPTSILAIDVIKSAFPDVPWIFVYRDPVHVMASNMKDPNTDNAPGPYCTAGIKREEHLSEYMADIIDNSGRNRTSLSREEYCAAFLATLTEAALEEAAISRTGFVVNYQDMPGILLDYVLPEYFNLPLGTDEIKRVTGQFSVYSKRMLRSNSKDAKDDSKEKTESASPQVLSAVSLFMQDSYDELQKVNDVDYVSNLNRRLTSRKVVGPNAGVVDPRNNIRSLNTCSPKTGVFMQCVDGAAPQVSVTPGCGLAYTSYSCGDGNRPFCFDEAQNVAELPNNAAFGSFTYQIPMPCEAINYGSYSGCYTEPNDYFLYVSTYVEIYTYMTADPTFDISSCPAPESEPTPAQTPAPTPTPDGAGTQAETARPTKAPTDSPTKAPTDSPTKAPTDSPTKAPTDSPTKAPTDSPTKAPTDSPTKAPTNSPTPVPEVEESTSVVITVATENTTPPPSPEEPATRRLEYKYSDDQYGTLNCALESAARYAVGKNCHVTSVAFVGHSPAQCPGDVGAGYHCENFTYECSYRGNPYCVAGAIEKMATYARNIYDYITQCKGDSYFAGAGYKGYMKGKYNKKAKPTQYTKPSYPDRNPYPYESPYDPYYYEDPYQYQHPLPYRPRPYGSPTYKKKKKAKKVKKAKTKKAKKTKKTKYPKYPPKQPKQKKVKKAKKKKAQKYPTQHQYPPPQQYYGYPEYPPEYPEYPPQHYDHYGGY